MTDKEKWPWYGAERYNDVSRVPVAVFGRSGAGKSTFAALLAKELGTGYCETSHIILGEVLLLEAARIGCSIQEAGLLFNRFKESYKDQARAYMRSVGDLVRGVNRGHWAEWVPFLYC